MKIFAVYLRLNLTTKPEWFDDFRSKHSSTSILHITLIQPRYIDESKIQDVKDRITKVLGENIFKVEDKKIFFDVTKLEWDEDDTGYILMSFIRENQSVFKLQKALVDVLREFDTYCSETTREYELNFRPHLTVANGIDSNTKEDTLKYIPEMNGLEGNITDLVLAIVKEKTLSESENPDNWTVFNL